MNVRTLFQNIRYFSSISSNVKKQVCIIGSGPAGFYFAQHLIKLYKEDEVQVDIYEKLPVPFGLVRYGVAPDHPDVKNVINTFTKTAQKPNIEFIGNVSLGEDISYEQLRNAYHAIVLAYGCCEEKVLGITGEDKNHVYGARRLVGWYNGLPQDSDLTPDLSHSTAIILGQGNVAIDVARILLSPIDELRKTDIPQHALAQLAESKISKVYLVGRRGPLQAAFTIKEFREMTKLPGVSTIFSQMDVMDKLSTYLGELSRPRKRLTELMMSTASAGIHGQPKSFCPLFYRKPKKINSESVTFTCTSTEDLLKGTVVDTDEEVDVEGGLIIRSVGYFGTCPDPNIPFTQSSGTVNTVPGVYGVGWIGTGPTGVILQTMNIAFKQAESLGKDFTSGAVDSSSAKPGSQYIKENIKSKGLNTVSFKDWEKIDKVEKERGAALGKPREKILDVNEMLEIASKI